MKNKITPFITLALVFFAFIANATPNNKPTIRDLFIPQNDSCRGQEKNISNCSNKKGIWSCPLAHCLSPEELQILDAFQEDCNQMTSEYTECTKNAFRKFQNNLAFQTNPGKKCNADERKIEQCSKAGLQWNCAVGICLPTRISLYLSQNLYSQCGQDNQCRSTLLQMIKKHLCLKNFKNEDCIPDSATIAKAQECAEKKVKLLSYYSPWYDVCVTKYDYATFFDRVEKCVKTKSSSQSSLLDKDNKPFSTIDDCIDNLDKEFIANAKALKSNNK